MLPAPTHAGGGPRGAATPHRAPEPGTVRRIDSREILGAAHEIEILHGSQVYRLRLTSLGKLILTK